MDKDVEELIQQLDKERERILKDAMDKKQSIIDEVAEEIRQKKLKMLDEARKNGQSIINKAIEEANAYREKRFLENKKVLDEISNISEKKVQKAINLVLKEVLKG